MIARLLPDEFVPAATSLWSSEWERLIVPHRLRKNSLIAQFTQALYQGTTSAVPQVP
jgi:hypothetical protein